MAEGFKTIDLDGVSTAYLEAGATGKPVLVLIHAGAYAQDGFFNNALCWEFVIEDLGKEFHVFALDTLGQGRTALPAACDNLAFDDVIDHVKAFAQALELKRFHVVGHDEGALVAVRMALDMPDAVLSCCAVGANSLVPSGDTIENEQMTAAQHVFGSLQAQRWMLERSSASRNHIARGAFLETAGELAVKDQALETRRSQQDNILNSINRLRVENFVRFRDEGFPVPVLLLWGNDDPLAKRSHADQWGLGSLYSAAASMQSLFNLIGPKQRATQMKLISGAGYMPFREMPGIFVDAVAGFAQAAEDEKRASN